MSDKRIYPLKCIFGCTDPVVVVVHTPDGCYCAGNKYQPRCMEHLRKLYNTNEGQFEIVEDFRIPIAEQYHPGHWQRHLFNADGSVA